MVLLQLSRLIMSGWLSSGFYLTLTFSIEDKSHDVASYALHNDAHSTTFSICASTQKFATNFFTFYKWVE